MPFLRPAELARSEEREGRAGKDLEGVGVRSRFPAGVLRNRSAWRVAVARLSGQEVDPCMGFHRDWPCCRRGV